MKCILIFISFLIIGCATTEKYEKILDTWVGSHPDKLYQAWGPPSNIMDMSSGEKMITYISDNGSSTYISPQFGYASTTHYSCKTTFYTNLGVIHTWRYEGNACKSE